MTRAFTRCECCPLPGVASARCERHTHTNLKDRAGTVFIHPSLDILTDRERASKRERVRERERPEWSERKRWRHSYTGPSPVIGSVCVCLCLCVRWSYGIQGVRLQPVASGCVSYMACVAYKVCAEPRDVCAIPYKVCAIPRVRLLPVASGCVSSTHGDTQGLHTYWLCVAHTRRCVLPIHCDWLCVAYTQ